MIPEIKEQIPEIKSRDPFTEKIIACAYKVHRELGPGFQEKIYQKAMKVALGEAKLSYETEKQYKVIYQNREIGVLKVDLVLENKVIVEIKAITGSISKVFEAQLLSYLRITHYNVGLLINFGNKSCQVRRLMI